MKEWEETVGLLKQNIHLLKTYTGIRFIPVDEGPGEIIDGVLFVLDGFGDDFGVEMVMKAVIQMRLDGQRLVQELLKEVLFRRLAKDHAFPVGILVRTTRSTAHLDGVEVGRWKRRGGMEVGWKENGGQ